MATSWRGGDDLPRPGHGALVALSSWPVAVFSARFSWRCLRCSWRCSWRGVARGVASAGFVCRGPKKRRRADTADEDTRGRPAAGSATWRHVLVRLHTRFVRCALLQHKLELDTNWIHEPGQRSGGLSPPRQLQIEQMGADSTTACTSPRTRWRSLRVCLRVFALRVRVSVCERGFACACVCVSVWAGFVACPASVLRTPGRPRAPAAARTAAAVRSPKILLLRVFDNNECTDRYCAGIRDAVLRGSGW